MYYNLNFSKVSGNKKIMLTFILRRLQPIAEELFSEEKAGFRDGRSTYGQIFNLGII